MAPVHIPEIIQKNDHLTDRRHITHSVLQKPNQRTSTDSPIQTLVTHSFTRLPWGGPHVALHLILTVDTIGTNWAIAFRILGVAPSVPLAVVEKFYPVIWTALSANAATGVLLFLGHPCEADLHCRRCRPCTEDQEESASPFKG